MMSSTRVNWLYSSTCSGIRLQGSGFRLQVSGLRVQDLGETCGAGAYEMRGRGGKPKRPGLGAQGGRRRALWPRCSSLVSIGCSRRSLPAASVMARSALPSLCLVHACAAGGRAGERETLDQPQRLALRAFGDPAARTGWHSLFSCISGRHGATIPAEDPRRKDPPGRIRYDPIRSDPIRSGRN